MSYQTYNLYIQVVSITEELKWKEMKDCPCFEIYEMHTRKCQPANRQL